MRYFLMSFGFLTLFSPITFSMNNADQPRLMSTEMSEEQFDEIKFEHVRASDAPIIFPSMDVKAQKELAALIHSSHSLKSELSFWILLPKDKYFLYVPKRPDVLSGTLFCETLQKQWTQKKYLDMRTATFGVNVVRIIAALNKEPVILSGDESDKELLKYIDYYLLWNNENIIIDPKFIKSFALCHQWCLDGNIPGYKNWLLCNSFIKLYLKEILIEEDPHENIHRFCNMMLSGDFALRRQEKEFFALGLSCIAEKVIFENSNFLEDGILLLPAYLDGANRFPSDCFHKPFYDDVMKNNIKITEKTYAQDSIFGKINMATIGLNAIFVAAFKQGKTIEAKRDENNIAFFILPSQ